MSNYQQTITEIVEKVKIVNVDPTVENQDWTIAHPDYPPLKLDPVAIVRFQQMPAQLQRKYSIDRIQNYLYDIYFSHSLPSLQEIAAATEQLAPIKNNIVNGVDVDFLGQLQQGNRSQGYFDPGWQVVAETDVGEVVVVKDGLHLHLNRSHHLPPNLAKIAIGDLVPIYLPPQLVGVDAYIMVGNFGSPTASSQDSATPDPSVRVYFNFTPNVALAIAQKLTDELNQLSIPFQFAILHNPEFFHRYDSGTLWLPQAGYLAAKNLLATIYQEHQAEFSPNIPLFSQQLAPGLGIAEELAKPNAFGLHRCELLAIGLITAVEQGKTTTAEKLQSIRQEFAMAEVDWLHPYFNSCGTDQNPQSYLLFG
jgi:HopA1 effector protein family